MCLDFCKGGARTVPWLDITPIPGLRSRIQLELPIPDGFSDGLEISNGSDPLDDQDPPSPVPTLGPLSTHFLQFILILAVALAWVGNRRFE